MGIGVSGYRNIGEGKLPRVFSSGIGVPEFRGFGEKTGPYPNPFFRLLIFLRYTDTPTRRYGTGCQL